MAIEVEQKFAIADRPAIERRLSELGRSAPIEHAQVDSYFAHPSRDFAASDEALRLRRVGELNYITYKGPKLDARTKTRREIEISLPPGDASAADAAGLLGALGFTPVADVRKQRTHCNVPWQGREVGVSLDTVEGLGDFVELEIVCDEAGVAEAKDCLASLATRLDLAKSERRSYLELLLCRRP
jgi:adenylate cyclase class 2